MSQVLQNRSRAVTNIAEYLILELTQRHSHYRCDEPPLVIFRERHAQESTSKGRSGY
jgi:hypothetical protein